jgi:hypothetical protein
MGTPTRCERNGSRVSSINCLPERDFLKSRRKKKKEREKDPIAPSVFHDNWSLLKTVGIEICLVNEHL